MLVSDWDVISFSVRGKPGMTLVANLNSLSKGSDSRVITSPGKVSLTKTLPAVSTHKRDGKNGVPGMSKECTLIEQQCTMSAYLPKPIACM